MTRFPACLAFAMVALAGLTASVGAPRRIVSINLCADQLVLALADRGQIAALTRYASDPELSVLAAAARGVPALRGSAEEVLVAAPDMVIGMPATGSPLVSALPAGSYRAVDLGMADSYADIVAQIGQVARAVGHPDRGAALVARMDRALAGLPRGRRALVAAHYQRRGFLTGTGTLVDDLMTRAGLVNLARRLGRPPLSRLSLEEMVAARPDLLIIDGHDDRDQDAGAALLRHPVLAAIPRVRIPAAWTTCGGPAYVAAARALSRAAQR